MEFYGTENYISTQDLSVAVNAAINLEKPLVVKGEPGTGKTELARQVAKSLKLKPLWRLRFQVCCLENQKVAVKQRLITEMSFLKIIPRI